MAFPITRSAMMFLFPLVGMLPLAAGCSGAGQENGGAESATDEALDQTALAKITATPFKDRCGASPDVVSGTGAQRLVSCLAKVQTDATGAIKSFTTPSGLTPTDLRAAYAIPTSTSTATIAIVDAQDDPDAEADLGTYRKQFGLPACTTANGCFKKVNEQGAASPLPTASTDWAGEIMLDLEMASAACPTCKILLVEATAASIADLGTSVNTAATLGASVISNSYGGGEDTTDTTSDDSYYHHVGVAIFASSGDDSYGVSYPASGRWVIGVGGTSLASSGSTRGWAETAWDGAGSGCSKYTSTPSWQIGGHAGCAHKMVSDLSAIADPNTGVAVYDKYGSGGWAVYGGTSVASPLVASIFAATGHANAYGATVWKHTSDFFDVTSGSNGTCKTTYFCTAGKGYDGPTGWGTPNATKLAAWGAADDVKSADE